MMKGFRPGPASGNGAVNSLEFLRTGDRSQGYRGMLKEMAVLIVAAVVGVLLTQSQDVHWGLKAAYWISYATAAIYYSALHVQAEVQGPLSARLAPFGLTRDQFVLRTLRYSIIFALYPLLALITPWAVALAAAIHAINDWYQMKRLPPAVAPETTQMTADETAVVNKFEDPRTRALVRILVTQERSGHAWFGTRPAAGKPFALLDRGDVQGAMDEAVRHPESVGDPNALSEGAFEALGGNRVAVKTGNVLFVNADGVSRLPADSAEYVLLMSALSRATRVAGLRIMLVAEKEADLAAVRSLEPMQVLARTATVAERLGKAVVREGGRIAVGANLAKEDWAKQPVQPVALDEQSLLFEEGLQVLKGIYLRVLSHEIAVELRAIVLKAAQA